MEGIGTVTIAKAVRERVSEDSVPVELQAVIAEAVRREGWVTNQSEAIEVAEVYVKRVLGQLVNWLAEANADGTHLSYDFNSSTATMIQGSCFVEPSDDLATRQAKERRRGLRAYLDFFSRISPSDFEHLCNGILMKLGVEKPGITPLTADDGIDFYGELAPLKDGTPFFNFSDGMTVWLVGQAKHYPDGKVATPEIRELVGSVTLARGDAYSRTDQAYDDLRLRVCDPVFFVFMTTGVISRPGMKVLQRSGVVGVNGTQLATFMADNGIGQVDSAADADALDSWLQSCRDLVAKGSDDGTPVTTS